MNGSGTRDAEGARRLAVCLLNSREARRGSVFERLKAARRPDQASGRIDDLLQADSDLRSPSQFGASQLKSSVRC